MTKYQKTKRMMQKTGLSKADCQKWLRASGWDLDKAIIIQKYSKVDWSRLLEATSKACDAVCKAMAEAINSIDWQKITESAKKALEGLSNGRTENRIDQREVQGMSETDTGDCGIHASEGTQMQESADVQGDSRILEGTEQDQ